MNEEKIDYRKVSPETMLTVKKTVIAQWKAGKKTSEIQENTGLCINTVCEIIRKYKAGGMKALQPKKEGRPKDSKMVLTEEQSVWVRETSSTKHRIS